MRRNELSLVFETLESKILMAGDVEVKATNSGLKLTGDVESNVLLVERVDADTVRITGNSGTTINGSATAQLFDLGNGNVKLNFKQGGNDFISTVNNAGGDLELRTLKARFGDGNDTLGMQSTNTEKSLVLSMGEGTNLAGSSNGTFRGAVRITAGDGNDGIALNTLETSILAKTSIKTRAGNDSVSMSGYEDAGLVEELVVQLGDGEDSFLASNNRFTGLVEIDGGADTDSTNGSLNVFTAGNPIVLNVENRAGQW